MNLVSYFIYLYILILCVFIVRQKSEFIFDLVCDSFKLQDEKNKFNSWKSRIEGVGSSISSKKNSIGDNGGNAFGSTSSNSYGGTISSYYARKTEKKVINNQKEEEKPKEKQKEKKKEKEKTNE